MSSQKYDSDSEGDDFNPVPEVGSDDEREQPARQRSNRDDEDEPESPVQSRRDEPRRSSVSRDDDDEDARSAHGRNNDEDEDEDDPPRKARDDDDDEDEDEDEDDEDDMPVRNHALNWVGGGGAGAVAGRKLPTLQLCQAHSAFRAAFATFPCDSPGTVC